MTDLTELEARVKILFGWFSEINMMEVTKQYFYESLRESIEEEETEKFFAIFEEIYSENKQEKKL